MQIFLRCAKILDDKHTNWQRDFYELIELYTIVELAWDGFPFSLVPFSRLYVAELR